MSGWTIAILHAEQAPEYPHTDIDDEGDREPAMRDIIASFEEDDRVQEYTTECQHAYAYLDAPRYDFDTGRDFIEDYREMSCEAAILGADDTTDTGEVRYYAPGHRDKYAETQEKDGYKRGRIAAAKITARHGILVRDPFHDNAHRDPGELREMRIEKGTPRGVSEVSGE